MPVNILEEAHSVMLFKKEKKKAEEEERKKATAALCCISRIIKDNINNVIIGLHLAILSAR